LRFKGDDGTLDYAKAAGVHVEGMEAQRRSVAIRTRTEASGHSELRAVKRRQLRRGALCRQRPLSVFNVFDMRFYQAIDPLPGASNDGGAVWGRLGDKLVSAGVACSVTFVPIAFGGSFIREWAPGGPHCRRLMFALQRLAMAGLAIDLICWHQGEAEANLTDMQAQEYCAYFGKIVEAIRSAGTQAPIYVAVATLCATADHPFKNRTQIRQGKSGS
jgi:hypothetical protein